MVRKRTPARAGHRTPSLRFPGRRGAGSLARACPPCRDDGRLKSDHPGAELPDPRRRGIPHPHPRCLPRRPIAPARRRGHGPMPRRRQQDAASLAHDRIDGLLAARDMTLKDLGKPIGVSVGAASATCRSYTPPPSATLGQSPGRAARLLDMETLRPAYSWDPSGGGPAAFWPAVRYSWTLCSGTR